MSNYPQYRIYFCASGKSNVTQDTQLPPMVKWSCKDSPGAVERFSAWYTLTPALATYILVRGLQHTPVCNNFPLATEYAWPGWPDGYNGTGLQAPYQVRKPTGLTWFRVRRLPSSTDDTVTDQAVIMQYAPDDSASYAAARLADLGFTVGRRQEWGDLEGVIQAFSELMYGALANASGRLYKDAFLTGQYASQGAAMYGWGLHAKLLLSNGETQEINLDPICTLIRWMDALLRPYTPFAESKAALSGAKLTEVRDQTVDPTRGVFICDFGSWSFTLSVAEDWTSSTERIKTSNAAQSLFFRPGAQAPDEWSLTPIALKGSGSYSGLTNSDDFGDWWAANKPQHSDVSSCLLYAIYNHPWRQWYRTYVSGTGFAGTDISSLGTEVHSIASVLGDEVLAAAEARSNTATSLHTIEDAIGGVDLADLPIVRRIVKLNLALLAYLAAPEHSGDARRRNLRTQKAVRDLFARSLPEDCEDYIRESDARDNWNPDNTKRKAGNSRRSRDE